MSEINSPAKANAGFDRRAVVKGAAWSVPVIAAAIAAPAAAASERSAIMLFGTPGPVTFRRIGSEGVSGQNRGGSAARTLTIQNTPGAITGTIMGIISIEPKDPVAIDAPGVRFGTLSNAPDFAGSLTGTTFSGSFSYTGTIAGSASLTFTLGDFRYDGGKSDTGGIYTMVVQLTFPDGFVNTTSSEITLGK